MTLGELKEIVDQRSNQPSVLGRLACNLHSNECEQRHSDGRNLAVQWENFGGFWRCIVSSPGAQGHLAKVDVHDNATVHVEACEPCSITVSPEDGVLCLTRYRYDA